MTLGLTQYACPVSLEALASLYRADPDAITDLVEAIPEVTRARLAIYLYRRNHTHELGLRVAATCEGSTLRRAAGLIGNLVYEQSRQPYARPGYSDNRFGGAKPEVSLGGSQSTGAAA